MCELCVATTVFDPSRHTGGKGEDVARLFEVSDAAQDFHTIYALPDGGSFRATLESAVDQDWVSVELVAGLTYHVSQFGHIGENESASDVELSLYDADGNVVAQAEYTENSDRIALSVTVAESGTYFIGLKGLTDKSPGAYQIDFMQETPTDGGSTVASISTLSDYLVTGYWEDTDRGPRAFDTEHSNAISVNLHGLSEGGKTLARYALDAWAMVADISFVETNDWADVHFDDVGPGAYAFSSTHDDTIDYVYINVSQDWIEAYGSSVNSYTMIAYLHEVGHALGLGHMGNYNGGAVYGQHQAFANDSWQVSVMSYFSQSENTTVRADFGVPVSIMMADIAAVQSIYGEADEGSATAGNTVWGYGSTLGTYMDSVFEAFLSSNEDALGSSQHFVYTIYDRDGTDLLDLSPIDADNWINMEDGQFSDIRGRKKAMAIAEGTDLENLTLGAGNDTALGNHLDNEIRGGAGDDSLFGAAGHDWIWGGVGADTIAGGADRDILFGNSGGDLLLGDAGNDLLVGQRGADTLAGGTGNDVLSGGQAGDLFQFDLGFGYDRIKDFSVEEGDLIGLSLDLAALDFVIAVQDKNAGNGGAYDFGLTLTFSTGDVILFDDVQSWSDVEDYFITL